MTWILTPRLLRADEVFDDDGVLIALVLQPERVLGLVDELAEALAAIADAPDEMGVVTGVELGAVPVGVEALHRPRRPRACAW